MDQIQCVWPRNLLVWASWLSNDNGIHFAGWRRLSPTTTRDRLGADFMLAHRHQRWTNINPISGQLVTFAGISTGDVWTAELTDRDDSFLWPGDYLTMSMLIVPAEHQQSTPLPRDTHPMLGWCWASVGDAGPALTQHRTMYSVSKALHDSEYTFHVVMWMDSPPHGIVSPGIALKDTGWPSCSAFPRCPEGQLSRLCSKQQIMVY